MVVDVYLWLAGNIIWQSSIFWRCFFSLHTIFSCWTLPSIYRHREQLSGCMLNPKPCTSITDKNKCIHRHVRTKSKPSLISSVPWFWGGVGAVESDRSWRRWRILKAKGGLLQPSSLICPITITHTSWHLNSPPCLACRVSDCFFFFFFLKATALSLFEYVLQTQPTAARCFKHKTVGVSYDRSSF